MSPKQYYTFMIEPDLLAALKAAKQLEPELSEGAILRTALREWLERHGAMTKAASRRVGARRKA